MKPRIGLSTKIFLLASGNLLLLALVFLVFARFQLHLEFNSFLFGAQDRVVSLARQLTLDLEETPAQSRNELLRRYKGMYRVEFYLFENPAIQIGGPPVDLPPAVMDEIRKPPPRRADPPPPREGEGRDGRGDFDRPPPDRHPSRGPGNSPPLFEVSTSNPTAYWVGARIPIREAGQEEQMPGTLLMTAPSYLGTPLFFDYKPWLLISGVVVAMFVLCWLPFIRGLTKAVTQMSKVTEQIAEGRFDHQLPEVRGDELGVLAVGINRMASRLSGFVYGQKRFLGDIAHELCAPIARIQFALGILEHRTESGTVDDLQDEVRQMSSLVAELLSFSKAGMQQSARTLVSVDVARIVNEVVAREGVNPEIAIDAGLTAMADPESLSRAIANLLRNAFRYAGEAGPVALTARRVGAEISITVADHGPGLPEEELDRVFTPFHRVETSRDRASGGVGLGLSIVKNCVEACKGTVRCRNRVPSGLEAEIRLPASL
jgi:two-component system, OmpR family, sensor histidine kinase CpxA